MKKKSMLAILLATTMVLGSSMTTLAAEGTVSGGGSISGDGEIKDVDTEIYSVVVPTDAALTLHLDPKGLAGVPEGGTATAKELEAYAGKITCNTTPTILNKGSVDMKVDIELKLNSGGPASAQIKTNKTDVEDNTDKDNICLFMAPSLKKVTEEVTNDTPIAPEYTAVPGNSGGVVITDSAKTISFVLPATEYQYKNTSGNITYEKVDNKGNGTALAFGGWVNTKGDWSAYNKDKSGNPATKSVSMAATFKFDKNDGSTIPSTSGESTAYGMVTTISGNDGVEVPNDAVTPTPGALAFTKQSNGDYTCTIAAATAGKEITKIMIDGVDRMAGYNKKLLYDTSSKLFTIKADWPVLPNLTSPSYPVTVTINGTDYTITLTK